jgi:CRISPR-associated protein Csm3
VFQQALNQATLMIQLRPEGPLLIKSGREAGANPTIPDMNFVRTHHTGIGLEATVYLPGSSLKGTLRSYCERVVRTVGLPCCNPFETHKHSLECFCGKKLENEENGAKRHSESCAICRLFGNTVLGARMLVSDAYPTRETVEEANQTEQRDGISIDRLSGAVANGPFSLEVVTRGQFQATLSLENFELWQLGLVTIALRDLGSGLCPIGYGKSRGLGRMAVTLTSLEVGYPGRFSMQESDHNYATNLYSVGAFNVPDGYEFEPEAYHVLKKPGKVIENGDFGRVAIAFSGDGEVKSVLKESVSFWKTYAESHHMETCHD